MTMNGAVLPIPRSVRCGGRRTACYLDKLAGTIQNTFSKSSWSGILIFIRRNRRCGLSATFFEFTSQHMPRFNLISISGYHMQEAGATADLELAYTLADGLEYLRTGQQAGLKVDDFAPRLSFFWAIGMNFFMEEAKSNANHLADLVEAFNLRKPKIALYAHTAKHRAGALTAQDVYK